MRLLLLSLVACSSLPLSHLKKGTVFTEEEQLSSVTMPNDPATLNYITNCMNIPKSYTPDPGSAEFTPSHCTTPPGSLVSVEAALTGMSRILSKKDHEAIWEKFTELEEHKRESAHDPSKVVASRGHSGQLRHGSREKHLEHLREQHQLNIGDTHSMMAFSELAAGLGSSLPVTGYLWSNSIPVCFKTGPNAATLLMYKEAKQMIEAVSKKVKFKIVKCSADGHKIRVVNVVGFACSSLGNTQGWWDAVWGSSTHQDVSFDENSFDSAALAHEFLHALGFDHAHQRHDRDCYLDVSNAMTGDDTRITPNFDCDLNIHRIASGKPHGPYDYNSIMHYPHRAGCCHKDTSKDLLVKRVTTKCDALRPWYHWTSPDTPAHSPLVGNVGPKNAPTKGDGKAINAVYV